MEFSSNRLKQVHMQMYNIWVDGMLLITRRLLQTYGEQYSPAQTVLSGS